MKHSSTRSTGKKGLAAAFTALLVVLTFMAALVVASAPSADARAGTCEGSYSHNLDEARRNFKKLCHRDWNPNSGLDVCDWDKTFGRGFLCSGPKSFHCSGYGQGNDLDAAKTDYEQRCGEEWRSDSGYHGCYYSGRSGWTCFNNAY